MAFCRNCGKQLAENEICSCTAQNQQPNTDVQQPNKNAQQPNQNIKQPYPNMQQPYPNAQQPYPNAQQPYPNAQQPYPNMQQPYQQPYPNQPVYMQVPPQPQKKDRTGCIVAAVVIIPVALVIIGILAAILVPAMLGYAKKSKTVSANNLAKNIGNAANSAIVHMADDGIDVSGTYIITSGFERNVDVQIDTSDFIDTLESFYDDAESAYYFVVISDGRCVYAAAEYRENNTNIGSYPSVATVSDGAARMDGSYPSSGNWSLNDYYSNACAELA